MPFALIFQSDNKGFIRIYSTREEAINQANILHDLEEREEDEECPLDLNINRWRDCDLINSTIKIKEVSFNFQSNIITEIRF